MCILCEPLKVTHLVYFKLHSGATESSTTWEGNSVGSMEPSDFFPASTQSINIFFRVSFISKAKLLSHTCPKEEKTSDILQIIFSKLPGNIFGCDFLLLFIYLFYLHIIGQKNFIPKWHSFSFY